MKSWSVRYAAYHLGLSHVQILHLLSPVDAPEEVKELVEEEKPLPSIAGEIDINSI